MVIVVTSFPNITLGSAVVSVTVKVCSPPNAAIEMSTHLTELFLDPGMKIKSEERLESARAVTSRFLSWGNEVRVEYVRE